MSLAFWTMNAFVKDMLLCSAFRKFDDEIDNSIDLTTHNAPYI